MYIAKIASISLKMFIWMFAQGFIKKFHIYKRKEKYFFLYKNPKNLLLHKYISYVMVKVEILL